MRLKNNLEIERKFLLKSIPLGLSEGQTIMQAYIFSSPGKELRVRVKGETSQIAVKISMADIIKEEFEYDIPLNDSLRLIKIASTFPPIVKTRYLVDYKSMRWEIDFFKGENEGLILAEIELNDVEESFAKPDWLGEEVTYDKRYYNAYLYENPYKKWNHKLCIG